jgi:hypothetical protein
MKLENSTTYHKNPTFVLQHFKLWRIWASVAVITNILD